MVRNLLDRVTPVRRRARRPVAILTVAAWAAAIAVAACRPPSQPEARTFLAPEDAVKALTAAVKAGQTEMLLRIFGPDGQELLDSSDPVAARRNRVVFAVAAAERWRLVDRDGNAKVLVIGNEEWPFPVPLVKDAGGWRFDTAAGKEEIIARRIGRNELSAIRACRTYVAAQRLYARHPHDGKRAGLYAATFRSDAGRQNGLYWPPAAGQRRSPLGDLLAEAADARRLQEPGDRKPLPFHGYYFRILTGQGAAAAGGAKEYVVNGEMSGGFALVAWPARYDVTGIMTFLVNHDSVVREKDLGVETGQLVEAMSVYNPDASWAPVE